MYTGCCSFTAPFSANLRARIEAYDEGFVKIWVKDGKLLAAQALGYNVSEMIQGLANMVALGTPLNDVATIIHAHPTNSEITRTVLELALGKAIEIHTPAPQDAGKSGAAQGNAALQPAESRTSTG